MRNVTTPAPPPTRRIRVTPSTHLVHPRPVIIAGLIAVSTAYAVVVGWFGVLPSAAVWGVACYVAALLLTGGLMVDAWRKLKAAETFKSEVDSMTRPSWSAPRASKRTPTSSVQSVLKPQAWHRTGRGSA